MSKKRLFSLLLALLMIISIVSGCAGKTETEEAAQKTETDEATKEETVQEVENFNATGFPIVNEKITVRTAIISDPSIANDDKLFFQMMEEKTNIAFEFEEIPSDALKEKKNLLLASGDYPELFMKCAIEKSDELLYGPEGVFIELEDIIAEYAPNLTAVFEEKPVARKLVTTPTGHIYGLPDITQVDAWVFPLVNEIWLAELGLEKPTNLDEFYDMLVAFKEQDPNGNGKADELPLSLQQDDNQYFIKCFGNNWGLLFGLNDTFVKDGKVIHSPSQAQFKDMLLYFKKLYAEGLLDPESFTHTVEQFKAKGQGEDQLYGVFNHLAPFIIVGADRELDFNPIDPFPYEGEQMINTNMGMNPGTFVITDKAENPEALIRWVDYLYTEEGAIKAWMGNEGEHYKVNDDGTWEWILPEGGNQQDVRKLFFQGLANIPCQKPAMWAKLNDPLETRVFENRGSQAAFTRDSYPNVYFSVEDQKRLAVLSADINEYVNQTIVQAVTGDIDIEAEWDDYLKTIQDMGIDELLEIQQAAYDSYENN